MPLKMLLLIFICCSFAKAGAGQDNTGRSKIELYKALKNNLPDSTRQQLYNSLGKLYLPVWRERKGDLDSAFYFFRKSVYLSDSSNSNNNPVTNESLSLLAETYLRSGNLPLGQRIFHQAIDNYHKAGDKTSEAGTWNNLALVMAYIEPGLSYSQPCFDSALSLFSQTGNITKKIDALLGMAEVHVRKGMPALAEKEVLNLLKEANEKKAYNLADLYLYLAYLKRYQGNMADALGYALSAEKNLRESTGGYKEPEIYWELALDYDELNQPDNSIYWFKKCIEVRENKKASQYLIYRAYYLMVVQMIKSGRVNEAFELLQKTRQKNPPASPTASAILSQCLAYCFNAQSRFTMAEKNFLSMIKDYNEEVQDGEILLIAYYDVGKFYVDRSQFNKAGPYVEKAFEIINNTTIGRLKDLYFLRFKIDSANGNYKAAIEQFQQYKILNDSIFNIAKNRQIEELMIKYETEKKENNISMLQKENQLQQKSLKQAGYTRNYILTGIGLLLLIVGLLYNRYLNKRQTNLRLEAKQKEIENQNLSLHHLVKEKEWLVKEIHHRVKNNLHTIIGLLHTQSGFLKTEEALLAINESQHRIQAMSLIHEKLFQSGDLSTVEMSRYIRELADYLKHSFSTGQRIQFKLDTEELELKLSHSLPIGLILNEAITNSIKYAFPENGSGIIAVSLRHTEGMQYQLTITDNGKGLPEGFDFKKSSTMGMNLMEGLSEDMQGSLSIKNDNGTAITVLFLYDASVTDELLIQQHGGLTAIK